MNSQILYMLVILFTDTGTEQRYNFSSKAECEQVKPAVMQLYNGLKQPVKLSCEPRQLPVKPVPEKVIIKTSYKIKSTYKF